MAPIDEAAAPPVERGSYEAPSLEVGRTQWGADHAYRPDAPQGGTLFSVWTKVPDEPSGYPWQRGNMDVYVLRGDNWYIRCLVGNIVARSPSDARYNANTMVFTVRDDTWLGDYSYYDSGDGHADAPYRDWVWVAWQIIVADDAFTIRQWLKFGVNGAVMPAGESELSFASAREILLERGSSEADARAFIPSDARSFQIGSDHGFLTHARMAAQNARPSLEELEAIALGSSPDGSLWGDYPFAWVDGAPDLRDYSGHGRDLAIAAGGSLSLGPDGPDM